MAQYAPILREMQPIRRRVPRLLFHLFLLAGLLAVILAATHPRSGPEQAAGPSSYETTVSAFRVHARRSQPPFGQPRIRDSVASAFAGIAQRGLVLGDPGAPVTMRFYADPECPEARQFAVQLLPLLVRRWVRDGRLRVEYRGERDETVSAVLFLHQQMAVLAAGRQGRLWQYLELFYHYQGPEFTRYANAEFLRGVASEAQGLSLAKWSRDRAAPVLARRVTSEETAARKAVRHTPAFLIGPSGGRLRPLLHFTLSEPLAFEAAFEEAMG